MFFASWCFFGPHLITVPRTRCRIYTRVLYACVYSEKGYFGRLYTRIYISLRVYSVGEKNKREKVLEVSTLNKTLRRFCGWAIII